MTLNDELANPSDQLGPSVSTPPTATKIDSTRTNMDASQAELIRKRTDNPTSNPSASSKVESTMKTVDSHSGRKRQSSESEANSASNSCGNLELSINQQQLPVTSSESVPAKKKPRKSLSSAKRCTECNRKLKLAMTFTCRCAFEFCGEHRYPECHNCKFDYLEHGRKEIEMNNPRILREKLTKL